MYSMNPPLTPRRAAVLSFIRDRVAVHGQPPTLAEIAAACGLASRGAARKHVLALAEAGLVEVAPGQARGVRPVGMRARADLVRVPVLGRVAAGAPILSDAHVAGRYSIDRALFRPRPHFLLRVEGDSMRDAGILDGDLIAVHRTPVAEPGQIVVARLDDEITVKRLQRQRNGQYTLLPANPDYPPIPVDPDRHAFVIEGLHVGVIRRG